MSKLIGFILGLIMLNGVAQDPSVSGEIIFIGICIMLAGFMSGKE